MLTEVLRRAFRDGPFTPGEAAAVLGIKGPSSTLYRLKAAGILERIARGTYRFAPLDAWQRVDLRLEQESMRAARAQREEVVSVLAAKRFQDWLATGYLVRTGARRYRLNMPTRPVGGLNVRRK